MTTHRTRVRRFAANWQQIVEHTKVITRTELRAGKQVQVREARLDLMRRDLAALLEADAEHGGNDGYPSTTPGNGSPGGGKGGGATMEIPDEHGHPDRVRVTSVEAAVLNARPAHLGDPLHRKAVEAELIVTRVARDLARLASISHEVTQLRSTAAIADPPMCWVAQQAGLPWDIEWEPFRETDFAGVLAQPFPEPRRVSKTVYWFVRNHRRLPTREDLQQHLERGNIRTRA
jgi:hypothetical protein